MSEKFCTAAQRENRSFTQTAAWISGRTHTLRTLQPFFYVHNFRSCVAFSAEFKTGLQLAASGIAERLGMPRVSARRSVSDSVDISLKLVG
jgi:hypothetical protein